MINASTPFRPQIVRGILVPHKLETSFLTHTATTDIPLVYIHAKRGSTVKLTTCKFDKALNTLGSQSTTGVFTVYPVP